MGALGRTVRLFLVDGSAQSGVISAEIINWTGRVLVAPRAKLAEVLQREDADKTGLYILFGDQTETGVRRDVYIGESDNVGRRVQQHSKGDQKDFFETFCLITSSDLNLTKTHVRYLESRVTALAKSAGRSNVINGNEPPSGRVPESDVADMEFFLEQLQILLPVLGFDVLRQPLQRVAMANPRDISGDTIDKAVDTSGLELIFPKTKDGLEGSAVQFPDEIVVRQGTLARKNPEHAVNQYAALRQQLMDDGALSEQTSSNFLVFTRDVPFSSPSAASAVILGRNDNGRTTWHVKSTGHTLKAYQDRQAELATLNFEEAS
ncbi:GIY-YIG nuclease family protein [Devosia sp.]|uniref:GIY-YIG nuclease family protein n=1 Tax=Devosia sp. TaxID=1871048 RepID=UPI00326429C5